MKQLFFLITLTLLTSASFAQTSRTRNLRVVNAPKENPVNDPKRKAVVVGMSDYGGNMSLDNTLNDANDMANVFTKLGFEVTLLTNNDLRNLRINLSKWYNSIEGNDMAVFYFSGHGMEVDGKNYLIPVGAEMASQADVPDYTLSVDNVLRNMNEKQVKMKLLILDACRDNPFTRSWSRGRGEKGLASIDAPEGTFIAFAAAPGRTAADGGTYNLHNGVFTYYLKQEIVKKGLSIDAIFNRVTGDVAKLTDKQQTPFKNSSLGDDFYFISQGDNSVSDNPAPTPYNPPDPMPNKEYKQNQNSTDTQNFNGVNLTSNDAKNLKPIEGKAIVYVIRSSLVGALEKYSVYCDDQKIGATRVKQYLYVILDPGKHTFIFPFGKFKMPLDLALEAGKIYYIEQKLKIGLVEFKLVDESDGRKALNSCKLSPDNLYANTGSSEPNKNNEE